MSINTNKSSILRSVNMLRSTLVIVFSIFSVTDCARILAVIPTPSISHQVVFRPITQELAKRGHEVVVITTDPVFPKGQAPANLTEIDVHDLSYAMWRKSFMATTTTGSKNDLLTQIRTAYRLTREIFIKQLQTNEVQQLIQNKDKIFDLLLLEAWFKPALVLSHLLKAPTIQVSSLGGFIGNYETVGAPTHPLMYPTSTRQRLNNLTLWDKISELYSLYHMTNLVRSQEILGNQDIWDSFGHDVPPLSELEKNVNMLFLNVHPIWEGIRPVPPSVVYMGGIDQKPFKELPQDLETYLNSSKHGVIYVSFGTNVSPSLLSPDKIQAMLKVFSQLPYDILWKWDEDELPGQTKNIKISKWLPQSDLLRHPKIKLFITQAGLQSTDEAILAGVPLIGIPMLGDQWYNAEKYVQLGMGRKVEMDTLTSEALKEAIETVINDESYRRNVAKFRSVMHDQPEKPLTRVIWWIEHVIRHGGASHFHSPATHMPWSEFLMLDVVLALLFGALALLSVASLVLYYVYVHVLRSLLFSKKQKKN